MTSDKSDHDLLIELNAKVNLLVEKMMEIPSKCIRHDEAIRNLKEDVIVTVNKDITNLKAELEEHKKSVTWAWRFGLGSAVTIGAVVIGALLKYFLLA